MRRYAFVPSSPDPLEERITPGHSALAGAVPVAPAMTQSQDVNLYGLALGQAGTSRTIHLLQTTDATISPLGKSTLIGYLVFQNKGGANRPVQGLLIITNTKGRITVSLKGTVTVYSSPFAFASGNLTYKIISGFRANHGATGTGTVLYGQGPIFMPGRFLLDFGNYPPPP